MDIKNFVDLDNLQYIQNLFSDATGLPIVTVDAEGNNITQGSNFTAFCMKYDNESDGGFLKCVKYGGERTYIRRCYAGLTNFSSDIIVNGERAGAVIGGQFFLQSPDYDKFRAMAVNLGIDENEYIAALKQVPVCSEKMIRASSELLGKIVNQFVNFEYVKNVYGKKLEVFDGEVPKILNAVTNLKLQARVLQHISEKGNILSSNAAVEAKRAGDSGVGFAVVVQEFRRLFDETSSTYNKITEQTNNIDATLKNITSANI